MAVVIYGAGGQARVLLELMEGAEIDPIAGLIDDSPALQGGMVDGLPVLGTIEQLAALIAVHQIDRAMIAVGDNASRLRLATHARNLGLSLPVLVHPSAYVSPRARLGAGTVVMAGAVVGTHTLIGEVGIVNTNTTVDHDCELGDAVHIAPGATLAGSIKVGHRTLIGVGASVLPGLTIGQDCVVGAGSVVIRNVAAKTTIAGCPAKPITK